MNRQLPETIIRYLSFSNGVGNSGTALTDFTLRQWERTFTWLDNANLALYLLKKLRDTHADRNLPSAVLSRLEQNYSNNRLRVEEMASQFAVVNEMFRQSGVEHAVVKGFSLVPEFCPDARLRQQSDLDYLVDEKSLPAAQNVLGQLGYTLKSHHTPEQWVFWKGAIPFPATSSEQYDAKGRYVIELHSAMWEPGEHGIDVAGTRFSRPRTINHEWRGIYFPALYDEDAFLLQILHVLQHLLGGWIRMFWLYEIAYCLHRRANDALFWQGVEGCAEAEAVLPQFVAIVTELAAQFFQAPLPAIVQAWKTDLRPAVKVWLDNYGRQLAFEKIPYYELDLFSASKLVLFLHRQFLHDEARRRHFMRRRLLPWTRPVSIARSIKERPTVLFDPQWRHRQFLFHRVLFHASSGLRYLCEIPRWLWLNRRKAA
ncbi:MAG: nucleotidyltransferase family protein [Candidatus Acidiferrum sp.]